jgi:hypothetical protein
MWNIKGSDLKFGEALTQFQKVIRRMSDKAENSEGIEPMDILELDHI